MSAVFYFSFLRFLNKIQILLGYNTYFSNNILYKQKIERMIIEDLNCVSNKWCLYKRLIERGGSRIVYQTYKTAYVE
jgi:hypothetical protein